MWLDSFPSSQDLRLGKKLSKEISLICSVTMQTKPRKKHCSIASLAAPSEQTANVENCDDYFNRDSNLTSSDPTAERASPPETSPKDARHDHRLSPKYLVFLLYVFSGMRLDALFPTSSRRCGVGTISGKQLFFDFWVGLCQVIRFAQPLPKSPNGKQTAVLWPLIGVAVEWNHKSQINLIAPSHLKNLMALVDASVTFPEFMQNLFQFR